MIVGQGARLYLAAFGSGPLPERAPDALIADVYASRAAFWDQGIAGTECYRGAKLVGRAVERLSGGRKQYRHSRCRLRYRPCRDSRLFTRAPT